MSGGLTGPQLVEMQRQATLGRLLAGVAHEVSAPAGTILANRDTEMRLLDRIEQALADASPDRARQLLSACRDLARVDQLAGERIRNLVRSLKIAARAADPHPQMASVNEIVDSALQLAKAQFRERVTVQTEFATLPEVECFPHLLSQAILNLVTNAGQAIETEGTITAGTALEGDQVHIWIADTGQGIRKEDQEKVLKQEFTTKPLGVGTGLGLSIVQRIIAEDHHGAIDFESEWGRGTTFHIRIPLRQREGVEKRV